MRTTTFSRLMLVFVLVIAAVSNKRPGQTTHLKPILWLYAIGTLTVIDGSFLRVNAPIGAVVPIAVAGRIRFLEEPYEANVGVQFELPQGLTLSFEILATAVEATSYGEGRRHVLFALNTQLPVLSAGRCKVGVFLDGVLARELCFSMEPPTIIEPAS